MVAVFHNKFGLMGGNPAELARGGTLDRSQVLPFSLLMFDSEEGWQQYGVYETVEKAVAAVLTLSWLAAETPLVVVDTCWLLDCAVNDEPLTELTGKVFWSRGTPALD